MEDTTPRPEVTLRFFLPENESEMRMAVDGSRWHGLVWDLDQYLRGRLKYEALTEDQNKTLEEVRDKLDELMTDNNLTFEP